MKSILLTAFGPYDHWESNASELAVRKIGKDPLQNLSITPRIYPVDFPHAHQLLHEDLKQDFDIVVHVGQSPRSGHVRLELFALNIGREPKKDLKKFWKMSESGPAAYQVNLPLAAWAEQLNEAGVPAAVSFRAGTRLCNAVLYWSHEIIKHNHYRTKPMLIHIPLDSTLPLAKSAQALKIIITNLADTVP